MDAFSGYIYSALWLIIAVYLFYQAFKESKFLFFLSAFFLFLSGWYLADELLKTINLFEGVYSWIFRSVALVVLIICAIVYLRYRKNREMPDEE
ncbi:MAG: hypothetical protein IJ015_06400 [Ruminococcus sp.]|nr:hypothetical protein [Ruminococcus sp.]